MFEIARRAFLLTIPLVLALAAFALAPVPASAATLAAGTATGMKGSIAAQAKAPSASKAKVSYWKALKAQKRAKATYDAASVQYKAGARGFYRWIADNYDGWRRDDALEAIEIFDKSSFKKYTKEKNPNDATSLENMKKSVALYPVLKKKRDNDKYHKNLQPPSIRNVYIARAQVNANASSKTYRHMGSDAGCSLGAGSECLAWGFANPFDGWYDGELVSYEKIRKYTMKKYGVDIAARDEWYRFLYSEGFDFNKYLADTKKFGETGHYGIVCLSGVMIHHAGFATHELADKVFFGLARSGYSSCFCLKADMGSPSGGYADGYTIGEYTRLFRSYYDSVSPKAEADAYKAAKKVSKEARAKLRDAARPEKPTKAARSGKRVSVSWGKVKGADGYQISVSPTRQAAKVVAKAGKSADAKVVRCDKAGGRYVRVRSFVKVDGKVLLSKWSKPIRSN